VRRSVVKRATRPKSIALFAKFYLLSTAMGVANVMTNYAGLRSYAISQGSAAAGPIAAVFLTLLSTLMFWYFITRRASNAAKWLLVILSALSLAGIPEAIMYSRMFGWLYGLTFTASGIALLAALVMLFRVDAVNWLTDHDSKPPVDPAMFG
jgi:hypothetical protein